MKLKKLQNQSTSKYEIALWVDHHWKIIADNTGELFDYLSLTIGDIQAKFQLTEYDPKDYKEVMPFRPAAYRDFMLYEVHAIDAARGFVKKYMPHLAPIVAVFEKIFRKPFPKLKPSSRFYKYPIFYLGNHLNIVGDGAVISIPEYTEELDYELEIAAILIKPLKNATPEQVNDAIGGFVILNDFSARDIQIDEMNSGFGPVKSKNFASTISNVVVSADQLLPIIEDLKVSVFINDELITSNTSKGKKYSFQEAIAYASWEEQLHPGELFGSGTIPTCTGIENGRMLNKGDRIKLEIEHIGHLENIVG